MEAGAVGNGYLAAAAGAARHGPGSLAGDEHEHGVDAPRQVGVEGVGVMCLFHVGFMM